MAACVLAFTGSAGMVAAAACAGIAPCANRPAATAPPVFRKLRRFGELGVCFIRKYPLGNWQIELRANYRGPKKGQGTEIRDQGKRVASPKRSKKNEDKKEERGRERGRNVISTEATD